MIGIGYKQEKYTKLKILSERAKEYNRKYDELIAQGIDPQQVASILQKEEYEHRHKHDFVEEPYKVTRVASRLPRKLTQLEEQCIWAIAMHTKK